ncbi:BQ2448_7854 [Microbotryum intermedium]|uniref:BQ2448_7854 protein n=1 Tax=Microbotryum intermedium TaxID=269621 RepID=A0A238FNR9_9BASI|nr:BQ2448_7854 [Microbotryum intermedium]
MTNPAPHRPSSSFFTCQNGSTPAWNPSSAAPGAGRQCATTLAVAAVGGMLSGGTTTAGANSILFSPASGPAPYQVPVFFVGAAIGGAAAIKVRRLVFVPRPGDRAR